MESRTYHAASVIALTVLLGFGIVNFILGFWYVFFLSVACFFLQAVCYALSRFWGRFNAGLVGSALLSYLSLIINYFINSGINGPTLFIFLFTFNLLVIVTPHKLRYLWVGLHAAVVAVLLLVEHRDPAIVKDAYSGNGWRIYDIYFTYIIALGFLYYMSVYLTSYYNYEKTLAGKRSFYLAEKASLVIRQDEAIRQRNNALSKIAYIQSHELRAPVSSILGLLSIIKDGPADESGECIRMMETAVKDLDEKIRMIVEQTEEIKARP